MKVYSQKDTTIVITHPLAPPIMIAGHVGFNSATVIMATEKTAQDVAGDGSVMVSIIAGDNGEVMIEMQQTSNLYASLFALYDTLLALLNAGNVQYAAAMAITIRNITDGTSHVCTGVSFAKPPDKPYQAQGQRITWRLPAADIQTVALPTS
jgi:hypothetical protein